MTGDRIQTMLEKKLQKRWKAAGRLPYTLIENFDHDAENPIHVRLKTHVKVGDRFTIENVTYEVEDSDYFEDTGEGKAIVRMVRYRIPDTATTAVHKCPAKKEHFDNMNAEDIIRLEEKYGAKKVKAWSNKVKLKTYNKLESKCEFCGVTFWKKVNTLPDTVEVEVVMKDVENEDYEGGLEKEDLEQQVKDGTWLQMGDKNGHA